MSENLKSPLAKKVFEDLNTVFCETREKGVQERAVGLNNLMKRRRTRKTQFYG